MLFNVPNPVADVVERFLISNIVHQQNTHSSSIVSWREGERENDQTRGRRSGTLSSQEKKRKTCRDGSEALLTSGIPNLQLNLLAFQLNSSDFEIDTNCRDEAGGV